MSLAERRRLRLFTLAVLYVGQGIPWGFTAITIPTYLTSKGLDAGVVGASLALTTLPYSLKWVWGPLMDTLTIPRLGRRRPWIVLAQLMMALTIATLIAIPDLTRDLQVLAWVILVHTVFNAMQDVAVDALAVDLLDDAERATANGLMYACKYGGGFIGGYVLTTIIEDIGMRTALVTQTAILLAIMMVPFLVRERAGPLPARLAAREVARGLAEAFSVRSALVATVLMLTINLATGFVTVTSFQLYVGVAQWTPSQYAELVGGWGLLVGTSGALVGGLLAHLYGARRVAGVASIAMALGWVAFAFARPWWHDSTLAYSLAIHETLCQSIMSVALFTMCMQLSLPKIGASQFAAYMALMNFGTTLGYLVAGDLNRVFEFHGVYLLGAGIQLAATPILLAIDPGETRRVLPRPPGTVLDRRGMIAMAVLVVFLGGMTVRTVIKNLG